jgi:hypothetical protein
MPRIKNPQQFYGLHLVLFEELRNHIQKQGYDFSYPSNPAVRHPNAQRIPGAELPNRDEILILIRVAENPGDLYRHITCASTIKSFGLLFAKWPDEILDILRFIRAKLAYFRETNAGIATLFLRTHSLIVNKRGEKIAIKNMTDKDIATHLTEITKHPTCPKFNMPTSSVKMARQKIAREDREKFFFSEHPQCQEFIRTGGLTIDGKKVLPPDPRIQRLLRSLAKGKK